MRVPTERNTHPVRCRGVAHRDGDRPACIAILPLTLRSVPLSVDAGDDGRDASNRTSIATAADNKSRSRGERARLFLAVPAPQQVRQPTRGTRGRVVPRMSAVRMPLAMLVAVLACVEVFVTASELWDVSHAAACDASQPEAADADAALHVTAAWKALQTCTTLPHPLNGSDAALPADATVCLVDGCVLRDNAALQRALVVHRRVGPRSQLYMNRKEYMSVPDTAVLLHVPRGVVDGSSGAVFNRDVAVGYRSWRPAPDVVHVDAPVLSLVLPHSEMFQHYVFDVLPVVDFVADFVRCHPNVVVLTPAVSSFRNILRPLWASFVHSSRFLTAHKGRAYAAAGGVYVVQYLPCSDRRGDGLVPPVVSLLTAAAAFRRLAAAVSLAGSGTGSDAESGSALSSAVTRADAPSVEGPPARRLVVYVGRGPGRVRFVANEDALLAAVRGALAPGLALVNVTDPRDWVGMSDVASHAVVLMGPHGGALANAALLPPGPDSHVVEFGKGGTLDVRQCFCGLTNALNMTFWRVAVPMFSYTSRAGMEVPLDDVLGVLREIGVAR